MARHKVNYDRNSGTWFVSEYSDTTGWFVVSEGHPDKDAARRAMLEKYGRRRSGVSMVCYRCKKPIKDGTNFHTLQYKKSEEPWPEVYNFCEDCSPVVEKELDKGKFKLGQRDKNNYVVRGDVKP